MNNPNNPNVPPTNPGQPLQPIVTPDGIQNATLEQSANSNTPSQSPGIPGSVMFEPQPQPPNLNPNSGTVLHPPDQTQGGGGTGAPYDTINGNFPPIVTLDPPSYPPYPPETPVLPPESLAVPGLPQVIATLCCIGFNPEDSMLEAVFKINDLRGIPGGFCDEGMVAHVGFWLTESSGAEVKPTSWSSTNPAGAPIRLFVGESTLRIQRYAKNDLPINYVVHKRLSPRFAATLNLCSSTNIHLPQLDCLLTITPYNQIVRTGTDQYNVGIFDHKSKTFDIVDSNFGGNGLRFPFSTMNAFIQFPKIGIKGNWEYFERVGWQDQNALTSAKSERDPSTSPIHTALLKNNKILMFMGTREGANNDIACLFDPNSSTFQKINDPLTHFLSWGYPFLPLLNNPTITNVPLDPNKPNDEKVIQYSGTGVVRAANSNQVIRERILIPRIRVPSIGGAETFTRPDAQKREIAITTPVYPTDFELSHQAFDSFVHDVFCSCHNFLADGRLFVIGGQEITQTDIDQKGAEAFHAHHDRGIKQVSIFDPDYNSWMTLAPSMKNGRWYPGSVIMGDGRVFVMDGHPDTEAPDRFHTNLDLEIFDPKNNSWVYERENNASYAVDQNVPDSNETLGFFPRLVLLPDGSIFCANRIETINPDARYETIAEAKKKYLKSNYCRWLSAEKIWVQVADGTNPNISPVVRQRYSGTLLPIFYNDNDTNNPQAPVQYRDEDISVVIYSLPFSEEKTGIPNKVFKINPLSTSPKWDLISPTTLKGRWNGNCVLLADGTVMFIGGTNMANNDQDPNLDTDILDPTKLSSPNAFTKGASSMKVRSYHSVATLLSDGRVLLTGTEPDKSYEIYTPDYLFRGPRPVVSITPDKVGYDQFIYVKLGSGWTFGALRADRCAIIRLGSVTHGWGFDQRYINLFPCHVTDDPKYAGFRYPSPGYYDTEFRLKIPQNPNLAPPGYYMLFVFSHGTQINETGAPSLGQIVRIG